MNSKSGLLGKIQERAFLLKMERLSGGEWFKYPPGGRLLIRPALFPPSIDKLRAGDLKALVEEMRQIPTEKIFKQALVGWKGIVDSTDRPWTLTDSIKEMVFLGSPEIVEFVLQKTNFLLELLEKSLAREFKRELRKIRKSLKRR